MAASSRATGPSSRATCAHRELGKVPDIPALQPIRAVTVGAGADRCENASSLESPGRANRQSVRVAELGVDALVLGTKRHSPVFGLHTYAVGEPVIGLVVTEVIPRTSLILRTRLPHESGDVCLQPRD